MSAVYTLNGDPFGQIPPLVKRGVLRHETLSSRDYKRSRGDQMAFSGQSLSCRQGMSSYSNMSESPSFILSETDPVIGKEWNRFIEHLRKLIQKADAPIRFSERSRALWRDVQPLEQCCNDIKRLIRLHKKQAELPSLLLELEVLLPAKLSLTPFAIESLKDDKIGLVQEWDRLRPQVWALANNRKTGQYEIPIVPCSSDTVSFGTTAGLQGCSRGSSLSHFDGLAYPEDFIVTEWQQTVEVGDAVTTAPSLLIAQQMDYKLERLRNIVTGFERLASYISKRPDSYPDHEHLCKLFRDLIGVAKHLSATSAKGTIDRDSAPTKRSAQKTVDELDDYLRGSKDPLMLFSWEAICDTCLETMEECFDGQKE